MNLSVSIHCWFTLGLSAVSFGSDLLCELHDQAVPVPQLLFVQGWDDGILADSTLWEGSLCLDLDHNITIFWPYAASYHLWTRSKAGLLATEATALPSALEPVIDELGGAYWISGSSDTRWTELPVLDVKSTGFFWLRRVHPPPTVCPAVVMIAKPSSDDPACVPRRALEFKRLPWTEQALQ